MTYTFRTAKDKIDSFASLEKNWDSYGGLQISHIAIIIANDFIDYLDADSVPLPDVVVPTSGGSVGFEWSEHSLEVEFSQFERQANVLFGEADPNENGEWLNLGVAKSKVAEFMERAGKVEAAGRSVC